MNNFLRKVLVEFSYWFFFFFAKTLKLVEEELPKEIQERLRTGKPVVYATLHEDDFGLLSFTRGRSFHVLISHSKDGALLADFLGRHGYCISRGSSSRGGARGLIQMIRSIKNSGRNRKEAHVAVDGPRGPRRKAKAGVLMLAEKLEAPIVPAAVCYGRALVFEISWSKMKFPKPFSKLNLRYGNVIWPDSNLPKNDHLKQIDDELVSLKAPNS